MPEFFEKSKALFYELFLQFGSMGGLLALFILLIYFILMVFKSGRLIDYLKYREDIKDKQLRQIDEAINTLGGDDSLKILFESDRRELLIFRRYRLRISQERADSLACLVGKIGYKIPLFKIIKSMRYLERDNDGVMFVKPFDWNDNINFFLKNVLSVLLLVIASSAFFLVFLIVMPPSPAFATNFSEEVQTIEIILLVCVCLLSVVGMMLVNSAAAPYRYAQEISSLLDEYDLKNVIESEKSDAD